MNYSIGQAAKKLHISIHTLRYYEKEGLSLPVYRDEHENRVYTDSNIQWFYMLRCLRDTGMPIRDIRMYIELFKQGKSTIPMRKEFLVNYQKHMEQQIQVLQTTKRLIQKKIEYYDNLPLSDNCYDYFNEWEDFKQILKESMYE